MINIAVEGDSDREAAAAIVRYAGREVGKVRVAGGKSKLDPLVPKYVIASRFEPWVVFRDSDSQCPVDLRRRLLPDNVGTDSRFSLRVAHSMTEAWLLADREAFSNYFAVSQARIPEDPEAVPHAKRALLDLVARSRSRTVREDVVAGSGETGPLYVKRLNDFASTVWRPGVAAERSSSLDRAVQRIAAL